MIAAIAALMTLLVSLLTGFAQAAHADNHSRIEVTNLKLVKSDANGNPQNSPLRKYDLAKLTFDWDAKRVDVRPGDAFEIQLPAVFQNREQPQTRPLAVEHQGKDVEIGSCELTAQRILCAFNETVETLKQQGYRNFSGSGTAQLSVIEKWEQERIEFTVNGSVVPVEIPGGIADAPGPKYYPSKFAKTVSTLGMKSKNIYWEIAFNTETLHRDLKAAGKKMHFDGTTRHTLTFTDTLGEGQTFSEKLENYNLMLRNSAMEPGLARGKTLVNAAGKDLLTEYGDFDLHAKLEGSNKVVFTVTGPFAPQSNYRVYYTTTPSTADGLPQPGFKYRNEVTLHETGQHQMIERYYTHSFSIDVKMEAGFGGFNVTKLLSGNGAAEVPAGTTFELKVKYTLPGNATTASYPNWTAPGSVSADKRGGETSYAITAGQKNTYNGTFPAGTVIELSEDPASASAKVDAIRWGTPAFQIGDQETNTLTIADRTSTPVELTNQAELGLGTFTVAKAVSGADAAGKDFAFDYKCTDGQSGRISVKGDGTSATADKKFALGTECTVTEDAASAQLDGYNLTAPAAQKVTIADATTPVAVSFTNNYARQLGQFSIAKTVTGGDFAGGTFAFTYECTDGHTGTLQVKGDGTPATSSKLPAGIECRIAEDTAAAERDGYALNATLSQDRVTIADGTVVAITASNAYERETGTFQLIKRVNSDDGSDHSAHVFDITYQCTDGSSGTLQVPGNGTPVNGPVLPTGTECTVNETEASKARDGYSVATTIDAPTFRIAKDAPVTVTVTNNYTRHVGGFTVAKNVTGDGIAHAPAEFAFDYECVDGAGQPTTRGSLTVRAGEVAGVQQVPSGSCRVTERDASAPGTQLATTLTVNGTEVAGGQATFEVKDGATVAISANNAYTLDRGTFQLAKGVTGVTGQEAKEFTFGYQCTDGTSGTIIAKGDGQAVPSGKQLPVGTECTVSEQIATAQIDGHTLEAPQPQTIRIEQKDQLVELAFVNAYTRDAGSFQIAKSVVGAAGQEAKEFTFEYQCTDGTTGTVLVKGDGQAVPAGVQLPTGTECVVSEQAQSAQLDGHTVTLPEPQTIRIEQKDQLVEASFVNAYAPVVTPTPEPTPGEPGQPGESGEPGGSPEPTPSATPGAQGDLATTGANGITLLIGIALAALIAGAVALVIRKRRA